MELTKKDQYGEIVREASFELLHIASGNVRIGKTDDKGILVIDDLLAGKYILKELEAPAGYLKKEDGVEIEIPYNKIVTLVFPNKKMT